TASPISRIVGGYPFPSMNVSINLRMRFWRADSLGSMMLAPEKRCACQRRPRPESHNSSNVKMIIVRTHVLCQAAKRGKLAAAKAPRILEENSLIGWLDSRRTVNDGHLNYLARTLSLSLNNRRAQYSDRPLHHGEPTRASVGGRSTGGFYPALARAWRSRRRYAGYCTAHRRDHHCQ